MSISDRYSCQEHGQDKHEDCIACEVYGDIAELVERIAELEQQAKHWEDTCDAQHETCTNAQNDCSKLLKENASLKEQLAELQDTGYLSNLLAENASLKDQFAGDRKRYNAGMERAAEIVKPLQDLKGSFAYRAIRKEIDNG